MAQPAPKPEPPRRQPRADPYPSAPATPRERREHMHRRNAGIQRIPADEYLAAIEAQQARVAQHIAEQQKREK